MDHSTSIEEILKGFEPVELDALGDLRYMNRIDTKYLFSVSKLPELLLSIRSEYKALEIEKIRKFSYKTVYFDTPELHFYNQHVTGKLNRSKVRIRTYESNGLTFLEVKQKSNKGRTSKSRLEKEPGDMNHIEQSRLFLNELISSNTEKLKAVINTGFTRITLVNFEKSERITIDYNLVWNNLKGETVNMPFLAIAEIKSEKSTSQSPFFSQLKKQGVRSTGFSKYAMGMAIVNGAPKQNNLKPKLLLIKKIRDEFIGNGTV
ncbi:MAG: polyphosphate polymerase domain-containing protein [Bacteroidales bacterium]